MNNICFLLSNWFEESVAGILMSFVYGIYSFVAKVYAFMIKLATNITALENIDFSNLFNGIYVLAGVFVLFRVVISLIQMLINPDTLSDKQAGASKLVTRILLCFVFLILFYPSGILFNSDENNLGIQYRLEKALLASDGIINSLFNNKDSKIVWKNLKETITNRQDETYEDGKICYYNYYGLGDVGADLATFKLFRDAQYRDYFKLQEQKNKYSESIKYKTLSGNPIGTIVYMTEKDADIIPDENAGRAENGCYKKVKYYVNNFTTFFTGIFRSERYESLDLISDNEEDVIEYIKKQEKAGLLEDKLLLQDIGGEGKDKEEIRKSAIRFSKNILLTFIDCLEGDNEQCETTSSNSSLLNTALSIEVARGEMSEGKIDVEFLVSIISGVAVAFFLIVISIDVIIRRFKLLFLQLIAPIPIIMQCNPKDTTFKEWGKMYIAAYADLFIKLIAVSFAVVLFGFVNKFTEGTGILKLLYIFAVLLFAKQLPDMISKIFGIKDMSGSFKDILGMGKKALGVGKGVALAGAGLAVGAAVGAATAKGAGGKVLGGLKGALQGAGSGYKGNVFGGAQNVSSSNQIRNAAIDSGMTLKDRILASAASKMGMPSKYEEAEKKKNAYDEFVNRQKAYNEESLAKVNKAMGNGYGNVNKEFAALSKGRNDLHTITAGGNVSRWDKRTNNDGTVTYVNKIDGSTSTCSADDSVAASHYANDFMTYNEAQNRLTGLEKAAGKKLREDFENGNYAIYGFNEDDADVIKLKSLHTEAAQAAKQANLVHVVNSYTVGNSGSLKDRAEKLSSESKIIMDENKAKQAYKQQKQSK